MPVALAALDAAADVEAVHFGEHRVEQNEIRNRGADGLQRFEALARFDDRVATLAQHAAQEASNVLFVVDDEDRRLRTRRDGADVRVVLDVDVRRLPARAHELGDPEIVVDRAIDDDVAVVTGRGVGGARDITQPDRLQVVGRDVRADVVRLASLAELIRRLDHLAERVVERDVWKDAPARHELDLVDHALVRGIGHREEDAILLHEDREDEMLLRDLCRDEPEVGERHDDLREVDARKAVLLAQRLEQVDLLDLSARHRRGGQSMRRVDLLHLQKLVELVWAHQLLLEQDLPELTLLPLAAFHVVPTRKYYREVARG